MGTAIRNRYSALKVSKPGEVSLALNQPLIMPCDEKTPDTVLHLSTHLGSIPRADNAQNKLAVNLEVDLEARSLRCRPATMNT